MGLYFLKDAPAKTARAESPPEQMGYFFFFALAFFAFAFFAFLAIVSMSSSFAGGRFGEAGLRHQCNNRVA
jgi:hypothetical protein